MSKKKNIPGKAPAAPGAGEIQPKKEAKPVAAETAAPQPDLFYEKLKGRELYFLLAAIVLGCIFIFRDFLTLDKVYLFRDIGSDSINIYFPWLVHMTDYIKANGVPTWTFSQGMGQNMFPLWFGDFFSNFIMLLGKEKLPYALAYVEVAKIILCGFVFYKYLAQMQLNRLASIIGAFLFAFCGYVVLGGCWTIFSNEALNVAILLYGFERWLSRGKWVWLVVGVALLSLLQPFLLFPYTLFLAVYIPVRYNDVHDGAWGKFPVFLIKTIGLAVIGVAISGYMLLPDLLQYAESPRVGGEASLTAKLKAQPVFGTTDEWLRFTTIFRMFGSDMLGTGSAFQGWQNYLEAPLFYCGILCLVTVPQLFIGLSKKQKIAYGIFGGLFILPVFFPFFRYSFWAFTGDYFRTYSFVVTLLLLIFSAKALSNILTTGKINLILLGITAAFLLGLLYTPSEQFAPAINNGLRSTVTLLVLLYAGLLVGITRQGEASKMSRIALLVIVFGEMVLCSSSTINDREVVTGADLKEKVGYNDYTVDAIKFIKDQDKSFFRVNKDYSSGMAIHASINDAKVQGYYSTPSYFSFNQKNYIKFLAAVNVLDAKDENATRWARGLMDRPLLFSTASGKYALTKGPGTQLRGFGYDSLAMFGNVKVFKNKFYVPLGFTYDQVLGEDQFKPLSPFQKDVYLLRGCVVSPEDKDLLSSFRQFNLADTATPFNFDQYNLYANNLRKDTLTITQFKESHIKGTINLSAPKILYFSMPYDEGWHATVNGADARLYVVNAGMTALKLPAGKSDVDLHFEPRMVKQGTMLSLVGILAFIALLAAGKFMGKKTDSAEA